MESEKLKRWFLEEKRDLPWRDNPSPYSVWVSEVMLQQTQVVTVLNYFEKWMQKFPTIVDLAKAPIEEVIKSWEGLGYYSRARNLHLGAKYIVDHFDGQFPNDVEDMKKIKGLGPYTINAIAAFAFHKKLAPVDGNVYRVLTRYFNIDEDICLTKVQKKIRELAQSILPEEESWVFSEALIELGAKVCKKKALCLQCPLKLSCQSFKKGTVENLPIKGKKIKYEKLLRDVFIIIANKNILVKKQQEEGLMKDLYEFPYLDRTSFSNDSSLLSSEAKKLFNINLEFKKFLKEESMSYTKYRVRLRPMLFEADIIPDHLTAIPLEAVMQLPFSSGPRRILKELLS